MKKHKSKLNKAFTVFELLITTIILSILLLIAIPAYLNYIIKTKITLELSNLTILAKEIYFTRKEGYTYNKQHEHIHINDYNTVTKDIGKTGTNIVSGYAEIMVRPEEFDDGIRWRCLVSGNEITDSRIPINCSLRSKLFIQIIKDNNMIPKEENFQFELNPIIYESWGRVVNGDDFLGNWEVTGIDGGDNEIEIWNNFEKISDMRENVAELDGDRNEIIELSHSMYTQDFKTMDLSFDYYSRTGTDSSNFEVYVNDELVYIHSDFEKGWQTINIKIENPTNSESTRITFKEAGKDESYGALIDLDSLKVTPDKIY